MPGNVQTRRKLELSSWDFDISNNCSRKQFYKYDELSYVMEVSEIVIIHESIKLICHMLKGFMKWLCC